jgi:hypothetical protein
MTDWKAVKIGVYLALEHEKRLVEEEMRNNPSVLQLKKEIEKLEDQQEMQVSGYKRELVDYDTQMRSIRDELVEGWDIEGESFKCDAGSATIRTTRALQALADAGLFDVDEEGTNIVHYDEKRNVIIHDVKNGRDSENEE